MKNKYLKILIIVFFIFLFFIFYYGLKQKDLYTPENSGMQKFPNLILHEFSTNKQISFDDILIDSNYYLVNIWASWCLPCRDEHLYLMQLKKSPSVKIIGINYKDKKNNAIKFLEKFGSPYAFILNDKDGTASIETGAYGVPESFILNKKKEIIKKIIGPIDQKEFKKVLKIITNEN